jgi:hypothetical protein
MSGGHQDDQDDMEKLLAALRSVAKDDDLAVARLPAEGYSPLSADHHARIAERILHAPAADTEPEKPRPLRGGVVSLDRRRLTRRRLTAIVFGPLAAAAAVVLIARPFSGPAPLPDYAFSVRGGIKALRGADPLVAQDAAGTTAPPQRLRPESRLVLVANPVGAVVGPVAVRAFVVRAARADEVRPEVQIAASGAVEIRAPVAEVFGGRSGRWDLVTLIGRPEALRQLQPSAALSQPADPAWRRVTVPLELESP